LLLFAGIYFSGVFIMKPGVKESNKIKVPVVVRKPVPARVKTPESLTPGKPLSTPSESVVYKVKKGDTLYKITERYTGDGWNYPKVARENKIPNPDLIFPDQKIKVPQ
jgi:nucleoid-associated protein YgaU